MKSHVQQLLQKPVRVRRMMSVSLDGSQMEQVEKLAIFFSYQLRRNFSKNQVVEEAVRAFVKESADYIAEEYEFDILNTALIEMQAFKQNTAVDVGVLDTVVLPVKNDRASRELLFSKRRWNPVQLDREKLSSMKYAAFYFCNPVCAVTHYAAIRSVTPDSENPKKQVLHFDPLEGLARQLEWEHPANRLRRPRYTVFSLLLEAKAIEELF